MVDNYCTSGEEPFVGTFFEANYSMGFHIEVYVRIITDDVQAIPDEGTKVSQLMCTEPATTNNSTQAKLTSCCGSSIQHFVFK